MKKIIILLFLLFFTFSCQDIQNKKTNQDKTGTGKIENNSGNIIEEAQKEAEECAEKSPIPRKETGIMWSFKNKSNGKCYYLGFNYQFFLIDENLQKNIKNDLQNNSTEFTKNINEKDSKFLKRKIFNFGHTKYNLLYSENVIEKTLNYNFQDTPILALFDEKNIFDVYLEKFKELNIILPENAIKDKKENFDTSESLIKWSEEWSEETKIMNKKLFVPVPKYFYNTDFENLYNILREKQQKELEK